ncbi:MAG: hypothetical protein M1822_000932 [Bathelium mastoideum]|nr:MAG: hypothetical protein M1822_000932 [Bathelium mastoideum]
MAVVTRLAARRAAAAAAARAGHDVRLHFWRNADSDREWRGSATWAVPRQVEEERERKRQRALARAREGKDVRLRFWRDGGKGKWLGGADWVEKGTAKKEREEREGREGRERRERRERRARERAE